MSSDGSFLDARNQLELAAAPTGCPLCGAHAPQRVLAHPAYRELQAGRARVLGVILECAACGGPVFRRYRISEWRSDRAILDPAFEEPERAIESFPLNYLPPVVSQCFREALRCYSAGHFQAFNVMCRLTIQAMLEDLGERSKMQLFEQLADIRSMARISDATFVVVRQVLFDNDMLKVSQLAAVDPAPTATLLEVMKDLLYQSYVRKAKLTDGLRRRSTALAIEPAAGDTTPQRHA